MIFPKPVTILVFIVFGITACLKHEAASRQQSTAQSKSTGSKQDPQNPHQVENDRLVKEILKRIEGRENDPAADVFENIKLEWLKKVPAGRFLRIMNRGYSRALGVACTHCHVEQDFASDEKRPKLAAREMAEMHRTINDLLGRMEHLEPKPEQRFINCGTCHRGAIDPLE